MVEFNKIIEKKWNITDKTASELCEHFENGDSVFYLYNYHPLFSLELDSIVIFNIFNFLQEIKDLSSKKKRVINALKKAGILTSKLENRIKLIINSFELDDILLPHRPNPRSRGQQAIKKGLSPLADLIDYQEVEEGTVEDLAAEYIGKHPSLKSADDVISGVKDILAERYAFDETVRSMVREVGFEDGFFEVIPRNKKDKTFASYAGKMIPAKELSSEEFLKLLLAEESKQIRFKHGIQLFHINELLRHHFIENPDSISFDILCEVIDDCWSRLLQPMVDRDAKIFIRQKAEKWALNRIDEEILKNINKKNISGSVIVLGKYDKEELIIVALTEKGHLLGATKDKNIGSNKDKFSNRLKQFYNRYRPKHIIIKENDFSYDIEVIIKKSLKNEIGDLEIKPFKTNNNKELLNSPWIMERCSLLEDTMKDCYAVGMKYLQPLSVIPQIGLQYFSIHPLQLYIPKDRLEALINLRITEKELKKGIPCINASDSVLRNFECVTSNVLKNIHKRAVKNEINTKNDLLSVEGMTEKIFRNISGFIVFPNSTDILDRTMIHPEFYNLVIELSEELNTSLESLVNSPDILHTVECEDYIEKQYIDQILTKHLAVGQQFPFIQTKGMKVRRKQRLSELKEGSVIMGTVTNITKFGVFVDINAVCDGLIHISQLTDGYIETADQVVKPNDRVDVRILKIDKKKRRVSLSMKKLGSKAPKIRPSKGQLTNLADHFKNR
jgi:uncharacterized protein